MIPTGPMNDSNELHQSPHAAAALYAPHLGPGGFFNPWGQQARGFADLLRWKLAPKRFDKRSPPAVPVVGNDGAYLLRGDSADSITWVGHSTFAIQDGGEVFLTDPHWGPRALLPKRLSPPGIPLGAVPPGAFALLSHNHYDHLDAWTVARLPATVDWYAPLGLAAWLRRHGARSGSAPRLSQGTDQPRQPRQPRQITELDWWQSVRRGRWTLTCLPAQHWSNRLGVRRNSTLWCSWLLDSGRRRYFFAGDSGYFAGFAEIGRRFAPIDVALLPIGAYEPRWFMADAHMDPSEAYRAFQDLGARWMVAMHWGTFDLTDEPADLPPRALAEAVAAERGDAERVRILAVGERWEIPEAPETPCDLMSPLRP
jgi:N-acyl-phosphatidylethanolamine-hydrolysing phospholipase D